MLCECGCGFLPPKWYQRNGGLSINSCTPPHLCNLQFTGAYGFLYAHCSKHHYKCCEYLMTSWTQKNPRQSKNFLHFMEPEGSLPCTQQFFPILRQINPVYALPPYSFKISFNIILPLMPGFQSSHLSLPKPVGKSLLPHVCHMICPSHPTWCNHPNIICWLQIMTDSMVHTSNSY